MMPNTAKGSELSIPIARKASGKNTRASSMSTAAIKKLYHQGERNKIANSDLSDILKFMN
jgi:hypothetical protein